MFHSWAKYVDYVRMMYISLLQVNKSHISQKNKLKIVIMKYDSLAKVLLFWSFSKLLLNAESIIVGSVFFWELLKSNIIRLVSKK